MSLVPDFPDSELLQSMVRQTEDVIKVSYSEPSPVQNGERGRPTFLRDKMLSSGLVSVPNGLTVHVEA